NCSPNASGQRRATSSWECFEMSWSARAAGPHADVAVDGAGNVVLNRKGLSVSKDWRQLPEHLIPEHLDDGLNGATGKGMNVVGHGTGGFDEGAVATGLELRHKAGTNAAGVVATTSLVPLARYQQDLAATRSDWVIDES